MAVAPDWMVVQSGAARCQEPQSNLFNSEENIGDSHNLRCANANTGASSGALDATADTSTSPHEVLLLASWSRPMAGPSFLWRGGRSDRPWHREGGHVALRIPRRCNGGCHELCARRMRECHAVYARLDDAQLDVVEVVRPSDAILAVRIGSPGSRGAYGTRSDVQDALRDDGAVRSPASVDCQERLCLTNAAGQRRRSAEAFLLGTSASATDA
jgi:hypothetical protein